jgi:hypothetical protein
MPRSCGGFQFAKKYRRILPATIESAKANCVLPAVGARVGNSKGEKMAVGNYFCTGLESHAAPLVKFLPYGMPFYL